MPTETDQLTDTSGSDVIAPCLTIILPTYELHFAFAETLLGSIDRFAEDPGSLAIVVVVEEHNRAFVDAMAVRFPGLRIAAVTTEAIMSDLAIDGTAVDLLRRLGKFSFQSIKKIGAVLGARTEWVLVMDSESQFLREFSVRRLLEDYRRRKYVFYTSIADRGPRWTGSLSEAVTQNASSLVGGRADSWYLEYYHWFYERTIWRQIVSLLKSNGGFDRWMRQGTALEVFENVLYYHFVRQNPKLGYDFVDSLDALAEHLPRSVAARASQALAGDLQIVGLLEHVTSLLSVDELPCLEALFSAYAMPFIRIEPYSIDPQVIETVRAFPTVRALVSSHRARVMNTRVAVCIAGEFRSLHANIRAVRDFTTGVACDIFVHCWNTPSVPAIKDGLMPTGIVVEDIPDVADQASRIAKREPNSKPGRDAGSLCMFRGISASIGLLDDHTGHYDLVVRMRPDAVFHDSLRDLLVLIADDESFDDDTIYVPDRFHSQGVNDQFAIGSLSAMRRYGAISDFVADGIAREYFNPEHLMARHLLRQGLRLKTLPMRYLLLRAETPDFRRLGQISDRQDATWWSAPMAGPDHIRTATALFAEKAKAVDRMHDRDQFGGSSILVSAEYLVQEAARIWRRPFLKIDVRRDEKNPEVVLVLDPATHGGPADLFVHVGADGLSLVPHRPAGSVFVQSGRDADDVRLVRFADDLSRPAATLTVPTHDPARISPASYRAVAKPPPMPVDDGGTSLMQHFLLSQTSRRAGPVRSFRADLALWRGRKRRRKGDLLTARKLYARLLALDPGRGREWVQYGHVLKDSGEPNEAIAAYAMALALQPNDSDARFHHDAVQVMVAAG